MEVVHLFSREKIDSKKLIYFLKQIKIKALGFWNNEEVDTQYGIYINSTVEFDKLIKDREGLSYTVEYDSREVIISLFENSIENYELRIYFNSLDLNQRESLLEELKLYFLKENTIFDMFFFDRDDDSHQIDLSDIYKPITKYLPESIKLIFSR